MGTESALPTIGAPVKQDTRMGISKRGIRKTCKKCRLRRRKMRERMARQDRDVSMGIIKERKLIRM